MTSIGILSCQRGIEGGQARAIRGYLCLSGSLESAQARVWCSAGRSLRGCPPLVWCGSFMACVLVGCRGEAWLKKGLLCSK